MPSGIYKRTKEVGYKISISLKRYHKKYSVSKETRDKISKGLTGRKCSIEQIQKRTSTRRKNGWWKNPEEHKKRISESIKGKILTKNPTDHLILIRFRKKYENDKHECENKKKKLFNFECNNSSKIFDWALKHNKKKHTTNRNDYYRLCRRCHMKYDNMWTKGWKIRKDNKKI